MELPFFDQHSFLYPVLAVIIFGLLILYQSLHPIRKHETDRHRLSPATTTNISLPSSCLAKTVKDSELRAKPGHGQPAVEYTRIFPPSRRETHPDADHQKAKVLHDKELSDNLIGFEEDFRDCDPSKYIASGFSVAEIKALGGFPDYSKLSGVPPPTPYSEFDIDKALPRPYRPFRWAYHQTMSLAKLEPDWWLELENTYRYRIKQRKDLYEKHGKSVLQWLPGSELACKELMEMCLQFLCLRYPHYFSLAHDRKTFENKILGITQDVTQQHPLLILLDNVPEDFTIMLRNPETGCYQFRAGIICSALGWNVGTKINGRLDQIHAPVPDYIEKMQFSMDRFFAKMPTDKPIQRGSWGLEVDQPLYMPPGDAHDLPRQQQSPELSLERCHLRVDWQTLRRLPLSASIVFNFKALFTPVQEFRNEPYIPSIILKILNEANEAIMKYKSTWHVEHIVKPALEQYEKEQIESGVIPSNWSVQTLDDSPWFPGWREKWHQQQGF